MTREAVAAIEGAEAAGATEIWVKDAHGSGRNLITSMFPASVRLIRSWAGHPFHGAGTHRPFRRGNDDRLSRRRRVGRQCIGAYAVSAPATDHAQWQAGLEFLILRARRADARRPTVFVSGDEGLMEEIRATNRHIGTCAVKSGVGESTISIIPPPPAKPSARAPNAASRAI